MTMMADEGRIGLLETEELETAPEGFPLEGYKELLAMYLLQGELPNAKFLWKRIPITHKQNPELAEIWAVGQKLWLREMPAFFAALNSFQWSPSIAPIMEQLKATMREKMLDIISTAYASVSAEDVSLLIGCTKEETIGAVTARGWNFTDGFIQPNPKPDETRHQFIPSSSSEEQMAKLSRLTEYVVQLE